LCREVGTKTVFRGFRWADGHKAEKQKRNQRRAEREERETNKSAQEAQANHPQSNGVNQKGKTSQPTTPKK